MSYGQQNSVVGQAAGRESTKAEQALNTINAATDFSGQIAAKLQDIRDRALGGRTEAASPTSPPRAIPNGTVGNIESRLEDLSNVLNRISALTDELGKVI